MQAIFQTRLGREGRVLIPSSVRQDLGFRENEPIHCYVQDGELRMSSRLAAIRKMQAKFAHLREPGVSWVDELSKERREASARENAKESMPS
jgi:bifunctional DNA-binding transcriptional regulator/antitoxin component of YhaV-PrlF toxin-antitoxin module